MAKTEMLISISDQLATMVKKVAAGSPQSESEVIERALLSYFNLGRAMNSIREDLGGDLIDDEEEANDFAVALVKEVRAERAKKQ
ncbi:MAG TPA: hypothetical protein VHU91_00265 [Mycobacteriales bacterium]|jgi:hypothetical protein|nr:hypothetical protein [Mycobacteriales bacterium]